MIIPLKSIHISLEQYRLYKEHREQLRQQHTLVLQVQKLNNHNQSRYLIKCQVLILEYSLQKQFTLGVE